MTSAWCPAARSDADQLEAVPVGQVQVEQEQVDRRAVQQRGAASARGVRLADDGEAGHPADVHARARRRRPDRPRRRARGWVGCRRVTRRRRCLGVGAPDAAWPRTRGRRPRPRASARRSDVPGVRTSGAVRRRSGSRTANSAPPSGARVSVQRARVPVHRLPDQGQAEAPAAGPPASWTSRAGRPPRRAPGPPRRRCPRPAAAARRRSVRWTPSPCTRARRPPPCAASIALSIRLPRIVTRSRAGSDGRQQPVVDAGCPRRRPAPRRARSPAPPCPAAARPGPVRRPPPTTWSVSACASSSSAVAKSTASSARPSSISETTVCSRFAASCACERSAWVKPRSESSSPGQRLEFGEVAQGDHGAAPLAAGHRARC